jgi:hypothetical protein
MVQVDYRLMHGLDLLVQVYNGISHIDSVKVVPSFYFYFRVAGMGKGQVVVATFRLYPENIGGCSLLLVVAKELGSWSFPQVVA